jgi:hypothetical protein
MSFSAIAAPGEIFLMIRGTAMKAQANSADRRDQQQE